MKKIISLFLAMLLVFSLAACKNTQKKTQEKDPAKVSEGKIKDATYEGKGQGKGGEINISLEIKDDQIKAIKVNSHKETPGFEKAMDELTGKIIKTNSPDVDSVSGCTLTSKGFIEAVNNALKNAGADKSMLKKLDAKDEKVELKKLTEEVDIVVIGGGGAGLTAAITAKENGKNVILIEKMPLVGGNTLISGAEMAVANNWIQEKEGIKDSTEQHIKDFIKGGDGIGDESLIKVIAENALAGAKWLRDDIKVEWEDELMQFGGHSVKRSLVPKGASGKEIITKLEAKAKELNIPIRLNTKATELIVENNKVVGVNATSPTEELTFKCKNIIIASGGFGSNVEMRIKYNPAIDEKILSTNGPGITGDGIVMAEKIGADLVGMEYIQTYPICDPLTGTLLYFDDARLYGHSVIVNKEGKRFVEELGRRDEMSMAIKAQTGSVCYEIIDENGYVNSKIEENHKAEVEYLYKNKLLVKADTVEEAAKFFDIDYKNFAETLKNYNKYVDEGKDPEFNKRSLPSKIEKGPFYIIKAAPAVHHTMGGIKIDSQARVIDKNGKVIEGLYAAGEVTGGIHGKNRLGSNAITDIIVFGRIAGQNASK
ncbi:flavocytochrome c [Peptoniphilaceae bacterium SGI.131]